MPSLCFHLKTHLIILLISVLPASSPEKFKKNLYQWVKWSFVALITPVACTWSILLTTSTPLLIHDSTEYCCSIHGARGVWGSSVVDLDETLNKWLKPVLRTFLDDLIYLRQFTTFHLDITMSTIHSDFKTSYGYNYERNQDLFFRFFATLKEYMSGQKQSLANTIDAFFHELLVRVVRLMLFSHSEKDSLMVDCVVAELEKRNPFERAPRIIKLMTIRAFSLIRIVGNSLGLGAEILSTLLNDEALQYSCLHKWITLHHCGICSGLSNPPPLCPNICRMVLDLCANEIRSLALEWAKMLDHLVLLAARLQSPNSFPRVNRPLQIHIADAIINLQRTFSQLDQSLLMNCSPNFVKTTGPKQVIKFRRDTFAANGRRFHHVPRESKPMADQYRTLERWSRLVIQKYSGLRDLFLTILNRSCTHESPPDAGFLNSSNQVCWNGERLVSKENGPASIGLTIPLNPTLENPLRRLQTMTVAMGLILRRDADPDYLPVNITILEQRSATQVVHSSPEGARREELATTSHIPRRNTAAPTTSHVPKLPAEIATHHLSSPILIERQSWNINQGLSQEGPTSQILSRSNKDRNVINSYPKNSAANKALNPVTNVGDLLRIEHEHRYPNFKLPTERDRRGQNFLREDSLLLNPPYQIWIPTSRQADGYGTVKHADSTNQAHSPTFLCLPSLWITLVCTLSVSANHLFRI